MVGYNDDAYSTALASAHTLAASIQPLLEAPAEGFFCNFPEFGRRIRCDILHGCEMCPLQADFQSREEPKVVRRESGDYGDLVMAWMLSSARNCCTSDVWLSALSWCRNRCPCLLSRRFLPNCTALTFVKLACRNEQSNISRRYDAMVYQTVHVKIIPGTFWLTLAFVSYNSDFSNQY
jgi:hypothetical protein